MTVLQPGSVVGERYRIERELAQGGYGAVYIAQHTVTEEVVALKVLWPHVLKSKDAVTRFQFEATVAAKIGSENIVRVLDAGFDEKLQMPFLVMELLKGKTLEAMVEQEGPMQPLEALSVLAQTASALDKAHSYVDKDGKIRPIIHRDLKPENLFFARRENGDPCIKILDFGIAKVLSETSKVSQEVKGTPLYMSHEQLVAQPIGPASDVWALGLIAFFLMTGKSYWLAASNEDSNINTLFAEILGTPGASATERAHQLGVAPTWPPSFDGWFARCTHRDASSRYRGAGDAILELSEILSVVDSSPASPVLANARTMLAVRYHLSQAVTGSPRGPLGASAPAPARSADASLGGVAQQTPPAPAPTHTPQSIPPAPAAAQAAMPLVAASLALAFLAISTLVFVLLRTPVAAGGAGLAAQPGPAGAHSESPPVPIAPPSAASSTAPSVTPVPPEKAAVQVKSTQSKPGAPRSPGTGTGTGTATATATATATVTAPATAASPPDKGDPFNSR
jgi:eukaryotic-like serine/threonine-protein kinase